MNYLSDLENAVAAWPNVTVHPHRFGGKEFRFGKAEIGHLHTDGTVDIPFPRAVRDALIADGQAEEHRWVPNSGWTTFRVRSQADARHAVELLRLSYLRYAVKRAADKDVFVENEIPRLDAHLANLLESMARHATIAINEAGSVGTEKRRRGRRPPHARPF